MDRSDRFASIPPARRVCETKKKDLAKILNYHASFIGQEEADEEGGHLGRRGREQRLAASHFCLGGLDVLVN